MQINIDTLVFDEAGLIPAVAQDVDTGQVLLVAWMNMDAVLATSRTRKATFWSRSRRELWEKGATSGNTLLVEDMGTDCDDDTLLLLVRPMGPTCHTGTTSCFGPIEPPVAQIGRLWSIVQSRASLRPGDSYTTTLLEGGDLAARKVLEEAGEVAFAAKDHTNGADRGRVVEEAADLVYHLLVLMAQHEIELADISAELRGRS